VACFMEVLQIQRIVPDLVDGMGREGFFPHLEFQDEEDGWRRNKGPGSEHHPPFSCTRGQEVPDVDRPEWLPVPQGMTTPFYADELRSLAIRTSSRFPGNSDRHSSSVPSLRMVRYWS
jgi:hypothetical protein